MPKDEKLSHPCSYLLAGVPVPGYSTCPAAHPAGGLDPAWRPDVLPRGAPAWTAQRRTGEVGKYLVMQGQTKISRFKVSICREDVPKLERYSLRSPKSERECVYLCDERCAVSLVIERPHEVRNANGKSRQIPGHASTEKRKFADFKKCHFSDRVPRIDRYWLRSPESQLDCSHRQ